VAGRTAQKQAGQGRLVLVALGQGAVDKKLVKSQRALVPMAPGKAKFLF
jgi:hypothetical protein